VKILVHRLAALADDLRAAGFVRLARAVEGITAQPVGTPLRVPLPMWQALQRQQPALLTALLQDLATRGIAVVTTGRPA
jgi:hypothetical protein